MFICARRVDRLAEVAAGRRNVFFGRCDVSDKAGVASFFDEVGKRTAGLDAVIHCAGVLGPLGLFNTVEPEEWFQTFQTNLFGTYMVARHAVALMPPHRRGRLLILSGGGAFDPMPSVSAYGASKAATVRLVETLAVELKAHNIAVNAVAPGFAATEIHKATLAAGKEKGGQHFERTVELMSSGSGSLDVAVDCIRYMISEHAAKLTGKTISARFDPWGEPEFDDRIDEILASPLYTTQRTSPNLMPHSELGQALGTAMERKRRKREMQSNSVRTKTVHAR